MIRNTLKLSGTVSNCALRRSFSACEKCFTKMILLPHVDRNLKSPYLVSRPISTSPNIQKGESQIPRHVSSYYDRYVFPEPPDLISEEEHEQVISKVNKLIDDPGRLFAVIHMSGTQYKVTTHDIISVSGRIAAECGEKIRLEKVSLVGGGEFTLVGKPIVPRNIVKIEATVIEKTPSVDIIVKKFIRRKRHERTHRFNSLHTLLRINNIQLLSKLE